MTEQRKTIFVVDDNLTNLTVAKNVLSGAYNIFTINSGPRLFKILESKIPDLILLDINMPDMDGYDVIRQLKTNVNTFHIPVIFLTALDDEDTEFEGLSLGAVDYIIKPFSPLLLLKRIELHLLVESQKQELINYNNNLEKMVEEKVKTVIDLKNALLRTMAELVEHRDKDTGGHIDRTQKYVKVLIDAMRENKVYVDEVEGWDEQLVIQSSQLHDVGKISVSDSILLKPGKLTPEEFETMKRHAAFGCKIIEDIIANTYDSEFLSYAKHFAVSHHEKWDGTGYPNGLSGESIPLLGRLMAIADVYDALTTDRPYKEAFCHEKAVTIILEGRGAHFDPNLVDIFVKVADEFKNISQPQN